MHFFYLLQYTYIDKLLALVNLLPLELLVIYIDEYTYKHKINSFGMIAACNAVMKKEQFPSINPLEIL